MPLNVMRDRMLCNCAKCGIEVLGPSQRQRYERLTAEQQELVQPLAERINGRPYCPACAAWLRSRLISS